MIVTTSILTEQLKNYGDAAGKILRMKRDGEVIPLTRGIYETDKTAKGHWLAGAIFGPSYLSFDYALSFYGLIPEAVYSYTCATFEKRKAKTYENAFGRFSYHDVPSEVYPYGIEIREENGYAYWIASPEKALCDKLYRMPPVTGIAEVKKLLFEDLRIDTEAFEQLNVQEMIEIGERYHASNLKYLIQYLRRRK